MTNDQKTDINWLKDLFAQMKEDQQEIRREMRDGFERIDNKLDMYREDFETKKHASERRAVIWEEMEKKADKEETERLRQDLEETKDVYKKVGWLVISTVIIIILGAFVTSPF